MANKSSQAPTRPIVMTVRKKPQNDNPTATLKASKKVDTSLASELKTDALLARGLKKAVACQSAYGTTLLEVQELLSDIDSNANALEVAISKVLTSDVIDNKELGLDTPEAPIIDDLQQVVLRLRGINARILSMQRRCVL